MATSNLEQAPANPLSAQGSDQSAALAATIFALLRARLRLILLAGLLAAIVTCAVAFLISNRYTATASFIPPNSSSGSSMAAIVSQLSSAGGGASSLLGGSAKSSGDLYIGILKSRSISSGLVERFHLKDVYHEKKESQAEQKLASQTVFTSGTKDPIVSISVTDLDPNRARDLANAYLDALRSTNGGLALTENSQRRQFFEQRLALEKDDLANAEVALKRSQEKSGLIAPVGQTAAEVSAIAQLRAQMAGREVRLASLRQYESDENPDIQSLQGEIGDLRSQITRMENSNSSGRAEGPSTAQVPGLELEYIRLARDVKYHETLFEIIAKQYEAARLDEAHDPTLQVLDRAITPDTKSGPHRSLLTLFGFVAGCFLASAWVLLRATRSGALDLSQMRDEPSQPGSPRT